jgi:arylsulfatase A-like enzyme
MKISLSLGVTTAFALVVAWSATEPRPTGLLIVTLDTTRADSLPVYGSHLLDTPALRALAESGVVFDHATTVAPLTLPAHSSVFTGLYPFRHGVRDNSDSLGRGPATLASILQERGFRTAASVGSILLQSDRGIARGFEIYRDRIGRSSDGRLRVRRPGNEVVDDAIAWLNTVGHERFFLWVHLYDIHQPYAPPEPFASRYPGMPYVGEVAFADSQIGRLLGALASRGLARRTVVIVAGDHGESLGEHGEAAHGLFVYDSVLRVPLLIKAPGIAARRVAQYVSLVDVLPTALDLLGVEPARGDGESLRPAIEGRTLPDRVLYAESMYPQQFGWSPLRAVRDGRFKFIEARRPELYDTEADPGELVNLIDRRPTLARALAEALDPAAAVRSRVTRIDEELRSRLVSLGYVATQPDARTSVPAAAADPKDHVAEFNQMTRRPLCCGTSPER